MSTRKTLNEQITAAQEEIRQREARLKELLQKHKEQERKERTHRLCERGGYLESIIPETVTLTAEQFKSFLDKTLLTDHAKRILNSVTGQGNAGTYHPIPAEAEQITAATGATQTGETGRQPA
jgi:hypothetical protein